MMPSYQWWGLVVLSFFGIPSSLVDNDRGSTGSGIGMMMVVTASFHPIANDYYEPRTSVTDTVRFFV